LGILRQASGLGRAEQRRHDRLGHQGVARVRGVDAVALKEPMGGGRGSGGPVLVNGHHREAAIPAER
jgi:hypothetical protein